MTISRNLIFTFWHQPWPPSPSCLVDQQSTPSLEWRRTLVRSVHFGSLYGLCIGSDGQGGRGDDVSSIIVIELSSLEASRLAGLIKLAYTLQSHVILCSQCCRLVRLEPMLQEGPDCR